MTSWQADEESAFDPALFHLPPDVRERYEALAADGDVRISAFGFFAYRIGAVPGSYHGTAAAEVASIPPDARYARVNGRAKDLRRLPELRGLEALELREVTDAALTILHQLPGLRWLSLAGLSTRSLEALRGHPTLEAVRCAEAARLRDVQALASLPRLRALWIDLSGPKELDGLAGLTQLRGLLFTGGLTSLPTLQPLAELTGLEHLVVGHVRIRDRSLLPLHGLRRLRTLELPPAFPLEELAALSVALPHTEGIPRAAFYTTGASRQFGRCKRCGSADVVLTTGTPARTLCRACDDAALRRHALRWELAVSSAAALGTGAAPPAAAPEPLTDDAEARIPASRRGPPPAPPAAPEEPWRQPEPKLPPPWTHRFLQTLKIVGGVGGVDVKNMDALFQGGVCPACGMARGPRTAEPLQYRHSSGQEVHYDGWMASGSPQGTVIQLFSENFITLLTDQERASLEWRPTVNTAYGKKTVFELAGSRWHLPLATLRGGAPYTPRCGLCGYAPPPRYASVTTLPPWLNPDGDQHVWRGQPSHYLSAADVPDPLPPCFTVGDWRVSVSLVLPPERWAALVALGRARRPRAISGWDLAVLPPELLEPAGIGP